MHTHSEPEAVANRGQVAQILISVLKQTAQVLWHGVYHSLINNKETYVVFGRLMYLR